MSNPVIIEGTVGTGQSKGGVALGDNPSLPPSHRQQDGTRDEGKEQWCRFS